MIFLFWATEKISAIVYLCFLLKMIISSIEDKTLTEIQVQILKHKMTACRKKCCLPGWGWLLSNELFICKGTQKRDQDGLKT